MVLPGIVWAVRVKKTVVVTSVLALALVGCADANQSANPGGDQPVARAGECAYPPDGEPARPADPPSTTNVATKGEVTATLHMTAGDVTLTLDRAQAPCTVNSFVSLIEQGF